MAGLHLQQDQRHFGTKALTERFSGYFRNVRNLIVYASAFLGLPITSFFGYVYVFGHKHNRKIKILVDL